MPKLDTVVLIVKNQAGKAQIVDSINGFKSSVAQGFIHLNTFIPAEWVDMVLSENIEALEAFKQAILNPNKEFLKEYYFIAESIGKQPSLMTNHKGKSSLSLNAHLLNLKSLGVLDFEPIFTSKVNNKPLSYGSEIGYMVRSTKCK